MNPGTDSYLTTASQPGDGNANYASEIAIGKYVMTYDTHEMQIRDDRDHEMQVRDDRDHEMQVWHYWCGDVDCGNERIAVIEKECIYILSITDGWVTLGKQYGACLKSVQTFFRSTEH